MNMGFYVISLFSTKWREEVSLLDFNFICALSKLAKNVNERNEDLEQKLYETNKNTKPEQEMLWAHIEANNIAQLWNKLNKQRHKSSDYLMHTKK